RATLRRAAERDHVARADEARRSLGVLEAARVRAVPAPRRERDRGLSRASERLPRGTTRVRAARRLAGAARRCASRECAPLRSVRRRLARGQGLARRYRRRARARRRAPVARARARTGGAAAPVATHGPAHGRSRVPRTAAGPPACPAWCRG